MFAPSLIGQLRTMAVPRTAHRNVPPSREISAAALRLTYPAVGSPVNVFTNTVVTIKFKLFDAGNQLLEELQDPLTYLHGADSGLFPKIEEALGGKEVGDSISVTLEPEDAFGDYDPELIRVEPLADLPSDIAVGGQLLAEQNGAEIVWRVTGIADGKAVLDGNHELAGQRLRFDATVLDIRPATAEEITHGHVHGAGGHHHHH